LEKRRREYSYQCMTERNIMCDEIQRNINAVAGINVNETDFFRPTPESIPS